MSNEHYSLDGHPQPVQAGATVLAEPAPTDERPPHCPASAALDCRAPQAQILPPESNLAEAYPIFTTDKPQGRYQVIVDVKAGVKLYFVPKDKAPTT
jgi:hypothetical protein